MRDPDCSQRVFGDNLEKKGTGDDNQGVGLAHSSEEAGNDRGAKGPALKRKGEGKHEPITELEEEFRGNKTTPYI